MGLRLYKIHCICNKLDLPKGMAENLAYLEEWKKMWKGDVFCYEYHFHMHQYFDMGGIYLLGKQRGTLIADNRIHDVVSRDYGAWGIYLDEGSSYVTVEKNAVYNTQNECFHIHYGTGNVVRNNVFYGVSAPCVYTSRHELHDQIQFERNIFVTNGSQIYSHRDGAPDLESRCPRP